MWGTLNTAACVRVNARFIPTYVGNTASSASIARLLAVHPHVCGEHQFILYTSLASIGSSPRMWGTPTPQHAQVIWSRFIPTYVGNTGTVLLVMSINTVHPHVCGEHFTDLTFLHDSHGSSPRMWGTPPKGISY